MPKFIILQRRLLFFSKKTIQTTPKNTALLEGVVFLLQNEKYQLLRYTRLDD